MADYFGTSGDDTETGTTGDDQFFVSAGMDVFDGNGGFDVFDLSSATAPINNWSSSGNVMTVSHPTGQTILTDFDKVILSDLDDFFMTSSFSNYALDLTIDGGLGDDHMRGALGNDTLIGGDGDDDMWGMAGLDFFDGGAGADRVSFTNFFSATQGAVHADLRTQTVIDDGFGNTETMVDIEGIGAGGVFADIFEGDAQDNLLLTLGFGDTVRGRGGDDFFQVDAGGTYHAGAGTDFLLYGFTSTFISDMNGDGFWDEVFASEVLEINFATGQIINDGYGNTGAATNFENGYFISDIGAVITGTDGDNEIEFFTNSFAGSTVNGGLGDDLIEGGVGMDTFYGGSGEDTLFGREGDDSLYGEGDADTVWGGDGNDQLYGQGGNDNLYGGTGDDLLSGSSGSDALYAAGGNDILYSGNGADEMYGGGGRDTLFFDDNDTVVDGGAGFDRAIASASSNAVTLNLATSALELAIGSDFGDTLDATGAATFVRIFGEAGNDTIIGGNANDQLHGGTGADVLTGGNGNDRFFFDTGTGADEITDFQDGMDRIDLRGTGVVDMSGLTLLDQGANGTIIEFGTDSVWLNGTAIGLVDVSDFIFDSPLADQGDVMDEAALFRAMEFDAASAGFTQENSEALHDYTPISRLELDFADDYAALLESLEISSVEQLQGLSASKALTDSNPFDANDFGLWDMF